MKNALAAMLVAAFTFIQFRNPATDELLFATDDAGDFMLDPSGNKMPIGVKAYGPGSKQYRKAFERIQTANIARGKKGLTGAVMRANATQLMAETIFEYANFDYKGDACSKATNEALLEDDEYAAVREQIESEQGDLGKFTAST